MRRRLGILAALLALSCAVQAWMITRAVVPAQDAVRYVLMAQSYERDGLRPSLKSEAEHPLFPILVWLAHAGGGRVSGAVGWALCAQVTAAAMLLVSLVFVYLLLLRLVDEAAAIAGALFYCLMTPVARLGADALADSTQLALYAGAVYCIARWWRTAPLAEADSDPGSQISNLKSQTGHVVWLMGAGCLVGLALLARPEAAVLLPALVVVIGWLQCSRQHRQPWPRLAAAMAALVLGLGLVQVPFAVAAASFSQPALAARVLGRDPPPELPQQPPAASGRGWRIAGGEKMEFGIKDRSVSSRFEGHASAAREYLRELPEAMQYWIGALALAGLWQMRRAGLRPFDRFALALFLLHSAAAIHFAAGLGYLSARHLVPLVPLSLAPAGYAAVHAGRWFWRRRGAAGQALGWATVVLAAVACLPRTLAALHPTRIGHRQAGQWLAAQEQPPGSVLDTRGWTALYSKRPTLRYDAAKAAYRLADLAFVVVEQRELELDSARARTLVHLLSGAAERVAMFAAPEGHRQDNVHVYRWHPERFTAQLRSEGG